MATYSHSNLSDLKSVRRNITRRFMGAALLVVGSFFIGMFLFGLLIGPLEDVSGANWALLEGVMSLFSASLLLGGSVFAVREYIYNEIQQKREELDRQEEEKKVAFTVYREIFDRLMSTEDVEARRWIITNMPEYRDGDDQTEWLAQAQSIIHARPQDWKGTPPGQMHLKRTLNTLDFVGFAALHYWPINDELLAWMSAPIAKAWSRIGLYVENEANERHEPDYYRAARDLGKRCVVWWNEHYPDSTIIDHAT